MTPLTKTDDHHPKERNKELWSTTNPFKAIDKDQFPVSRGNRKVFDKPKLIKRQG